MAMYQVPKEKQGYKNPKVETPGTFTKMPTSPVQGGGLMAAAAKAKALKPGIPPIPVLQPQGPPAMQEQPQQQPAARPAPAQQQPININVGVPGQAQQVEPRAQAAQAIAAQEMAQPDVTGGIPEGGLSSMGYMTDMKAAEAGAQKPGAEEEDEGQPWKYEEKDKDKATEWEKAYQYALNQFGDEEAAKGFANYQVFGTPMNPDYTPADPDDTPKAGVYKDPDGFYYYWEPGEGTKALSPIYDENGNQTGWQTDDGQQFPLEQGYEAGTEPKTDESAQQTSQEIEEVKESIASVKNTLEPWLYDYMASDLGISEEDIQNQVEQLKMASSDEIAKFAQQMASRGMGASGLVGSGMGQIQSSTMAAMANVRFEAAKLAIEDKLNRMKSYLALYGNMVSEEARVAMQSEINKLAQDQFDYQKHQDRIADQWQAVANWAAYHGAKGFMEGTLDKVWDMMHTINPDTGEYYTWNDIVQHLGTRTVEENDVEVVYVHWVS